MKKKFWASFLSMLLVFSTLPTITYATEMEVETVAAEAETEEETAAVVAETEAQTVVLETETEAQTAVVEMETEKQTAADEAGTDGEADIATGEIAESLGNTEPETSGETEEVSVEDATDESDSEEDAATSMEEEQTTSLLFGSALSVAATESESQTTTETEALCDHGNDAESCSVCNLEEQIAALPALDEVQAMTGDEEETVYAQASALADVYYDDLTVDEQAQVSNIDTLWDILDYFSSGLTLTALSVDTTWYNSTDTSFTLYDAADLAGLASLVNAGTDNFSGKTIVLGNSIDLNNEAWTPIGTSSSYPFNGTFDGNDYTVSGLYINDTSSSAIRQALFGYNGGTVKNITVSGNVTGYQSVGGVVGTNAGTVTNCTNCATVSATTYVGGVVGNNIDSGTVKNCYNSGSISGTGYLGGVVGCSSGSVANCINSGTVTGASSGYDYVGGVVGYNSGSNSTVKNCCNSGAVSGYYHVGGVVGENDGTVTSCYNSGTVSGTNTIGGVVGNNDGRYNGSVTNCYYLSTTASAAIGTDSGTATDVLSKTLGEFESGEVTYLLTGGVTDGTQAWYQTLGTDSYPVLDSTHGTVYYTIAGCNSSSVTGTYSNSSVIHAGSSYDNGFCTNCGAYQPATLSGNTYEISNAGQLFWFASLVNGDTTQEGITAANTSASAVLTADITIPSGYEWTPIGTKDAPYTGTFDGDGYTVSGMSITTASIYMGLFGYVSAGTVKNLTVSGAISVSGSSLYAGGIVGTVSNGTLSNLTSNVSVTVYDGRKGTFGGVAATVESGSTMEFCVNNGKVTASGVLDCVGGLVGYMNSATITNCANYGTVDISGGLAAASGGIYTGGIVGYINNASANVTNCFNVGTVSGVDSSSIVSYTGAIIGRINEHVGAVTNCYYLSSDSSTLAGVGANGSGVTVEPTAKTAAQFVSGEVAYLLNGSVSAGTTWYQNIDSGTADSCPVLDSSHGAVYYGTNCAGTAIYSNSTVPAATHSLKHVETQEATCTETGNNEYWYCSVCDGYFSDAGALGTTSLSEVTIPAKGHSWDEGTVTTEATCTEDGVKTYTCTVCGETKTEKIEATGHSYEAVVTEPTCTAGGYTTYTCSVCGDSYTANETEATGHNYEAVVTEPTCTAGGYTTYTCSVCGDSYTADETEAKGHSWDEGTVTTEATCTEDGVKTYTCTVCGETKTEKIEATGHSYEAVVTDPTCTEKGYTTYTCSVCGDSYKADETDATGHTSGEVVKENEVAATCTTDGSYDSVVYCTVCGGELSRDTVTIPATGHSFGEWETITSPTCEDSGSEQRTCSVCQYAENRSLDAAGHDWEEDYTVDQEAACTTDGSRSIHCKNCEAVKDSEVIPATGHTWDEGIVTAEAACEETGLMLYTCTVCQETKTEIIPASGHSLTHVVSNAATCTGEGNTEYWYCEDCGKYFSDEMAGTEISLADTVIPATGHSYGEWETVISPTCEDTGSEKRSCTVCGYTETRDVEPAGHDWEEDYTVDVEAGCTTDGSKSIHCRNCATVKDSEVIPATGHSYETVITEPTYTEQGYTVYTCTNCGDSYITDYTAIRVIDGTDENLSTKTLVQELTAVPEGLKSLYSSVDELISELISRVTVGTGYTADNALVYDVVLQYRINGGEWINATVDNFPATGITVTLPYPEGTDSSYEFTVLHMFTETSSRLGITAGGTETPTITKSDDGLVVTLTGLSPVAVSWKEAEEETEETETEAITESAETESAAAESETAGTESESESETNASPQTGDNTPFETWFAVLILSALAISVLFFRRYKAE